MATTTNDICGSKASCYHKYFAQIIICIHKYFAQNILLVKYTQILCTINIICEIYYYILSCLSHLASYLIFTVASEAACQPQWAVFVILANVGFRNTRHLYSYNTAAKMSILASTMQIRDTIVWRDTAAEDGADTGAHRNLARGEA